MRTRHLMAAAMVMLAGWVGMVDPAAAKAPAGGVTAQCILEPGVYAIYNSKSEFVGSLIVYPDCRTEIIAKKQEDGILL